MCRKWLASCYFAVFVLTAPSSASRFNPHSRPRRRPKNALHYAERRTTPSGLRALVFAYCFCKAACEDRPNPFGVVCLSQRLEEVQQAVARLEAGSLVALVWLKLGQCRFLKGEVGMEI